MRIRVSTDADRDAIRSAHLSAFGADDGPVIVRLVDDLLDHADAEALSLVAEADGRLLGHVLFTAARLEPATPRAVARILAPLAVVSDAQKRGIGGALIRDGLERLQSVGVNLVFVLGHPGYYSKFGFRPAGALGFDATHPLKPHQADAWMVRELAPGVIGSVRGRVRCVDVLEQPEHWVE